MSFPIVYCWYMEILLVFYVLTLYLKTFLNLLILVILFKLLGYSLYIIMSSANTVLLVLILPSNMNTFYLLASSHWLGPPVQR